MAERVRYRLCRVCGKGPSEVGPISARGLCQADSDRAQSENTAHLRARSGAYFERWYAAMHERFEHERAAARDARAARRSA